MINYKLELYKRFVVARQVLDGAGIPPQTLFNHFGSIRKPRQPKLVYEMAMLAYLAKENGHDLYELAGIKEDSKTDTLDRKI